MLARRLLASLLVSLAVLIATSAGGAAVDAGASIRFGFVPQKAFQGQPASLSVAVRPSGVRCSASLRYADGAGQTLKAVIARSGRAAWSFVVAPKAKIGSATVTVACGKAGRISRAIAIVGPPAAPAKVVLEKSGFSQRMRFTTREVSYGLVLANPSPEKDALDVVVLVNFVDATNRVVKTESVTVPAVRAESQYFLGGSTTIPDATPVSSLEVVTRIGSQTLKSVRTPALADVLVQASLWDPGYVGAVVGQILNDHPTDMLTNAQISVVLFDPAGNVIGGGLGYGGASLMPGVRAYFQASNGVGSIPFDRAAAASVSVLGTYQRVA